MSKPSLDDTTLKNAILVGVYHGSNHNAECQEHLIELELLAQTLDIETLQKEPCSVRKYDASTLLGSGKVDHIKEIAHGLKANVVIFDDELQPSQQRNLEEIIELPVIDRTEVILEVFSQRARSKEARLQIELAQIKYQYPRLKRLWTHLSRQRGGGVNQKGEGETQIEIDRRLLKKRVEQLQNELKQVQKARETMRAKRKRWQIPTFAIVGYTNAGKSSLLKALTDAEVLVEDKLFATLDTTARKFTLPGHQEIILIDTVGFIRKLPHQLIAAFRSTLEEAVDADILIHLIDISHPSFESQAEATLEVLKELGAEKKPMITVFNKIDKESSNGKAERLRIKYPKTVSISVKTRQGFDRLLELMNQQLSSLRQEVKIKVPQSEYALISDIIRQGQVISQEYLENDILMEVQIPQTIYYKVKEFEVEN